MTKNDILIALQNVPDNQKIHSVRFNTWGEIVIEFEGERGFYIFSNGELKKFK